MANPDTTTEDNRAFVDALKRRDARNIETIRSAIRELYHCVSAGPEWFTNERGGQLSHARMWVDRALASAKVIQETLEQAQDCIRGETPEDCSDEDAREDTVQKIREALGL